MDVVHVLGRCLFHCKWFCEINLTFEEGRVCMTRIFRDRHYLLVVMEITQTLKMQFCLGKYGGGVVKGNNGFHLSVFLN